MSLKGTHIEQWIQTGIMSLFGQAVDNFHKNNAPQRRSTQKQLDKDVSAEYVAEKGEIIRNHCQRGFTDDETEIRRFRTKCFKPRTTVSQKFIKQL
ncbi:hypothetical protein Tco_0759210 [Tanacetum coccineum]